MRKMVMALAVLWMALATFADATITSVTARQVEPWKKVEITVRFSCSSNELNEIGCSFVATNGATRAALPVTQIRQVGSDTGSGTSWTRHFIWDAVAELGYVKIDDVALTAKTTIGVQLWENGPYWASCNVGATKPEENGYYFWWGDTVGYKRNSANDGWVSVKDGKAFSFDYGKSQTVPAGKLTAEYDAATAHLGAPWRMPTIAEFLSLSVNCTMMWTTKNGVYGQWVWGKGAYAARSIFLPAAGWGRYSYLNELGLCGHYWSAMPYADSAGCARSLYFALGDFYDVYGDSNDGYPVRPIRGFSQFRSSAAMTHLTLDARYLRCVLTGESLEVEYSPNFADVKGEKTVRVLVNGEVWVESFVSGKKTFNFGESGLYEFEHQVSTSVGVVKSRASYVVASYGCVEIPNTLSKIPDRTFEDCEWLTSVVIPPRVTSVGAGAFSGCKSITSISVPASLNVANVFADSKAKISRVTITGAGAVPASAYSGCTALTRVEVASLADWLALSFADAAANPLSTGAKLYVGGKEMTNLVIPSGTTKIGSYAFAGVALTSVTIPSSVKSVAATAFTGWSNIAFVVPASLNVASVFADSKAKLASVTITGTGTVPASAYSGCTALTRVEVASFADWMSLSFANAAANPLSTGAKLYVGGKEMTNLVIPDGTTKIGSYAFAGGAFTSVTIPPSVTSIGAGAFSGCKNITSVSVPASLNVASVFADSKAKISRVTITGTGTIPASAYSGCTALTRVEVANFADWLALLFADAAANPLSTGAKLYVGGTELTNLVIPNGTTKIGSYAFAGGAFTSVTIPPSVTSVGTGAFSGCKNITSVSVPASLNAASIFADSWGNVSSLTLTGELASLDADFLSGCTALTTLVLPESVKRIDSGAFDNCPLLENITFPSGLEEFGLDAIPPKVRTKLGLKYDANGFMIWNGWLLDFRDRGAWFVHVPDGVIGIGRDALSEMHDMDTVELPDGVRYICARAFLNDDYLDNLVIPDSVIIIAEDAFRGCSYIQNLTVGEGLVAVGDRAFLGCTQLARFSAGSALETIGEAAFSNCWRMLSVALPAGMRSVASSAFMGCGKVTGVTTPSGIAALSDWFSPIVSQIRIVTVPSGVTSVCDGMFAGCSNLTVVNLPEGIVRIGDRAFRGCSSLEALKLPETVVSLGEEAFRGCASLVAFAMPSTVTTMGASVLRDCTSLKELTLSRGLTAIPEHAMDGCSSLDSFTVPEHVTSLGGYFFPSATHAIYYRGVAPQYDAYAYANARSDLTSYVWRPVDTRTPTGWEGSPTSRGLPTVWPTTGSYHRAIEWWKPNQYDVTFDANGGIFAPVVANTYACEQITYTWYALPPFEPTREGYRFNGYWTERTGGARIYSSTGVALTKPHTLYAQWVQATTVTIRFNPNGGTVVPNRREYTAGVPYHSLPVPTCEHYEFVGWYTEAVNGRQVVEASEVPTADQELFAHWTPCRYTIRFHANNGTEQTVDQTFFYGDTVTLRKNTFTCTGCSFAGWALNPGAPAAHADGKTLTDVANIEDDVVHLWACWSGNTYAVRFDSHGGEGVIPNQTFVIGVAQPLSKNVFTRAGFRFVGWALTTDSAAVHVDGETVKNLTTVKGATVVLYAVWTRSESWYSVFFEANGGIGTMPLQSYESGFVYRLPKCALNPPVGKTRFVGWRCSNDRRYDDGMLVFNLAKPGETVTMTAIWE